MPARTNARNAAPRRQERLDNTSQVAVAGSYNSSNDEIEPEDPRVTAARQEQRAQRLDAYVRSDGPWSEYNQRRQSEATAQAVMAARLRAFDQQYSPPRRSTSP